ncbi:MAG TPA: hypothetical protein DDY98_08050 [Ruminococcaceae bacterium]|nr:hypothetical protein [Oscillospiraceae bacterium]
MQAASNRRTVCQAFPLAEKVVTGLIKTKVFVNREKSRLHKHLFDFESCFAQRAVRAKKKSPSQKAKGLWWTLTDLNR